MRLRNFCCCTSLYAMLLYMLLEVLAATSRDQLTVLQQQEIMAASPELRHVKV